MISGAELVTPDFIAQLFTVDILNVAVPAHLSKGEFERALDAECQEEYAVLESGITLNADKLPDVMADDEITEPVKAWLELVKTTLATPDEYYFYRPRR